VAVTGSAGGGVRRGRVGVVRGVEGVEQRRVRWRPSVRVVPSRFPPVNLYARVADAADLAAVNAVESLTNDRLREASGAARRVAESDRVRGPGSSYVMAPFAHVAPEGGRFTDGTAGAWYAARVLETAIRETVHHRERFLRATQQGPIDVEMRVLEADVDGTLHDVRGRAQVWPELYDPDSHMASQAFARSLRAAGSNGIVYDSVRHAGGQCVAVFRPRLLRRARQAEHLLYRWNGEQIAEVLRLTHQRSGGRIHPTGGSRREST